MKKVVLLLCFVSSFYISFAQFFGQLPQATKYKAEKVIDPVYGIKMYDKLNFSIGGDSVRNDKKGYACQGWVQDTYENGAIIHKGYYEDGYLTTYKNFFEDGTLERSFKQIDYRRGSMEIFYPDGKKKSAIIYFAGSPQSWTDYYPNGNIEYIEESSKKVEYLVMRKSFTEDGKPTDIFELIDPKKMMYSKKEYYENGNIKSEGNMIYSKMAMDYQKDGIWKEYDENGKASEEKWVSGERLAK